MLAIHHEITLASLRYFVSVAEERSFTRAAQRLNVAQPALSRQISKLEVALGSPLFTRSVRGVQLTEAGEVLLTRAYTIFNQVEQTVHDIAITANVARGVVTVGMPPTPGELIAPPLLEYVRENYPEIELRFREAFSGDLLRMLNNNEISLVVMHEAPSEDDFLVTHLLDEYLWVVGKSGSLKQESYTFAEAAALPLILPSRPNFLRILVDQEAEKHKLDLNIVQRSDGVWITKALVRYGLGYTILTQGGVLSERLHGTVDAAPIVSPQINWTLITATRLDQANKPAFRAVNEAIRNIVERLRESSAWK